MLSARNLSLFWRLNGGWIIPVTIVTVVALGLLIPGRGHLWLSMYSMVVAAIILVLKPNKQEYRSIGLPSTVYHQHNKLRAFILLLAACASYPAHHTLWVYSFPLAAVAFVLMDGRGTGRDGVRAIVGTSAGQTERDWNELITNTPGRTSLGQFPLTPAAQLVVRPLIKMWGVMWAVALVIAAIFLILRMWLPSVDQFAAPSAIIAAAVLVGTHIDTLRNHVTMGGTRVRWCRMAFLIWLAQAVIASFGWAVISAVTHTWAWELLGAILLFPLIIVSFELTTRRAKAWPFTVVLPLLTLTLLIASAAQNWGAWVLAPTALLLALCLAYLRSLVMDRNLADAGFETWLGMAPGNK